VSGDHFHVSFSQFGGEMKHKTPREGGHSSSLSGEEDEQSTPKWCHFGKMCNSSSTSDASQLHLLLASNFQFRSISPLTNFNFSPRFQRLLYFGPWSQFFFQSNP
jgi:hypothetical protein